MDGWNNTGVKASIADPGNLLDSWIHIAEGENQLLQVALQTPLDHCDMYVSPYALAQNK